MIVIGITGSFGTGKTTVARMFKKLGAAVFDADKIAHKALLSKSRTYEKIVKLFGRGILKDGREIDRKKLGKVVFGNRLLLERLCRVMHPYVIKRVKEGIEGIERRKPDTIIVLDIPLLIEAGLLDMLDILIVVKTDKGTQIKRCLRKTHLARKEILARINAQMPLTEKIRFSDFVIDNSGKREITKREVRKIWEKIQQQAIRRKKRI